MEPSACNASWGACGAPVRSGWPTNAEAGEAEVVSMGDGSVVRARVLGTPPRVTVAHEVEGAAEASANDISGVNERKIADF